MLEPDRLCGAIVSQTVSRLYPQARVHCETEPSVAAVLLAERAIDLFIVALRGFDLDVITLLGVWADHDAHYTRVLVVTPHANCAALRTIEGLPILGVFDSSRGDLHDLETACVAVVNGCRFRGTPEPECGTPKSMGCSYVHARYTEPASVDLPLIHPRANANTPRWRN